MIGVDRAPKLSDRSDTPYIEATMQVQQTNCFCNCPIYKYLRFFLQENMRHSPHMALTVSHLLSEDMEFRGFHFPKGTQVFYCSKWTTTADQSFEILTSGHWSSWSCPLFQENLWSGCGILQTREVHWQPRELQTPWAHFGINCSKIPVQKVGHVLANQ